MKKRIRFTIVTFWNVGHKMDEYFTKHWGGFNNARCGPVIEGEYGQVVFYYQKEI